MKNHCLRFITVLSLFFLLSVSGNSYCQLVTNGGFESSDTGAISSTSGWLMFAEGITLPPIFEIVNDTVEQGIRSLKVTVDGLGSNPWDIQVVSDSIPIIPGIKYNYSIWAKAEKPGAQVSFTVGNYSYSEYAVIRPANLTTQWKEYKLTFTVTDNQSYIRAPIHFNYSSNSGNPIYIDNLKIIDENFGKTPIIVEAESGKVGTNFSTLQAGEITYVTTTKNYTGQTAPEDTNSMITYQVALQDSGTYNLFARIRVGSGTFDDDSFFSGRGFGEKNDTARSDWVFLNGLASAGFTNADDVVNDIGTGGSEIWKWVNITKNLFPVDTTSKPFTVSLDSLTQTFKIGSREDGLYIDKFAFGKSHLFYTVNDLDNELPGAATIEKPDSSKFYQGPPFAEGSPKFLGNAYGDVPDYIFANYWNQLTPGNAGKWGSVASLQDSTKWNWTGLDRAYNYAMNNNLIFKNHTLIWGQQQPSWISNLDSANQIKYIETWIKKVGERYPNIDMIDVVNEPLASHNPPDGGNGRANYKNALGGNGATGWDWVIKSFELARKYLPNAKLILNDYGIINDNNSTSSYLKIINLLKDRDLIDGIGVQGHRFEFENADTNTLKNNLNKLGATGLPVYISEFDLGNYSDSGTPNDNTQLNLYKKIFPILWKHKAVKGITLWGYLEGQMWQKTCYLVHTDGEARPALDWMAQYVKDNPVGVNDNNLVLPSNFELEQNFPNPFNPATNIRYNIANTTKVTLKVYDILGREVQTLVNKIQSPGQYSIEFNAASLSSGIYFYQLNAGSFNSRKKLVVLK
ncbi:MAG: endo-1,4-beta-xylanase [Ignavibacteriae bacterium]|nr:endo-1,4-beta-xylanase [Ignavibacteriota bacterium]